MKGYYFTFGWGQITKAGIPMKDYWVRVSIKATEYNRVNYERARVLFIKMFTNVNMDDPMNFGTQYEEGKFTASYFPKGEYIVIIEDELLPLFKNKTILKLEERNFYS